MIKKRLGIPIVDCNVKCVCNQLVDPNGNHLIHDCKLGDERFDTHDGVQHQILIMAKSCGLKSLLEEKASTSIANKSRADITIQNIPNRPSNILIDVAITNTLCKSANNTKFIIPGNAVTSRVKSKQAKYIKNQMINIDQILIPVVIDSHGLINQEGLDIISEITNYGEEVLNIPAYILYNYWIKRILIAAHKGMGNALLKRSYRIINNSRFSSYSCHPEFMRDAEYVRFN